MKTMKKWLKENYLFALTVVLIAILNFGFYWFVQYQNMRAIEKNLTLDFTRGGGFVIEKSLQGIQHLEGGKNRDSNSRFEDN